MLLRKLFRQQFKRFQSSVEEKVVPLGPDEDPDFHKAVIWFENVFPFKIPLFDPRMFYINSLGKQYEFGKRYEQLLPKTWPEGSEFKALKAEPNLKEGGLYLEFKYKGGSTTEALDHVKKYLKDTNYRSLFNLGPVNAFEVKGRPWVEDLVSRVPSRRLHVEFYGPDLTVEDMYREFRVFGRIVDINLQKSSDKEVPRYASVQFLRKRAATSARNCIHGELFGSTRLAIGYEANQGWWYKAWHWITANARISVLLILALVAGISYAIFDPWRVFSVTNQITGRYSFASYTKSASKWWHIFLNVFSPTPSGVKHGDSFHHWSERENQTDGLDALLKQTPESSILVSGPKGSGKSEFVNDVVQSHPNVLKINCSELVGKGDYQLLSHLSSQVNFFPTFGFAGQLSGLLDTLITASTGAKAGLATTSDNEVRKILETVTIAITRITEQQISRRNELSKKQSLEGINSFKLPDIQYPIIVIDDFLTKESTREQFVYDILAAWAGQLAEYRLAHVVFVSDNPNSIQIINKLTPTKSPEVFHLADANFDAAKSYITKRLGNSYNVEVLLPYLKNLGGRFNDLDLFASKIQSGLSPELAFDDMIHRAVTELRKSGNLEEGSSMKNGWTNIQFWKVATLLAHNSELQFDELVSHPIFSSDPNPILQMERAGLINFVRKNERPFLIKPNRPIFVTAFQKMIEDSKLNSYMGSLTSKKLISDFTKKIQEFEAELETLNKVMLERGWVPSLSLTSDPLQIRRSWLVSSIGTYHQKVAKEEQIGDNFRKNLKLVE